MIVAMKKAACRAAIVTAGVAALAVSGHGAFAQSQADFYRGKTITIIVGTGAGGSYGIAAQLLARYWASHISGKPTIIVQAMPGGGGLKMAGYLHNVAPADGTVVGMALQTVAMAQMLKPKDVKHDVRTWPWIGNMASLRQSIVVMAKAPVRSFEDARKQEVVIGATARSGNLFIVPQMAKEVAGAKFKIVLGYRGGSDINKAMESGEVQGRGGTWQTWNMEFPGWLKEGKLVPLVLTGKKRDPDWPKVPLLRELVADPLDRQVVDFFGNTDEMARPFAAVPKTPRDVVEVLRTSFEAAVKDPKMIADAARRSIPVEPTSWRELEKAALGTLDTPPKVVERLQQVIAK